MSITSMSARAGMAQKLSIPQLKQAIQDGVVPPYVGIPLLQEKVKMAKSAEAAQAGQMGAQPNVAEQVMAQAQQVEQGVPALQSNLPASMAGGGIVAFAEGGMFDEEDTDEDRIDAERQAEMDSLMDEYAQTFQGGIGQLPAAAAAAPSDREGIAGGDAADFVAKIMHKESRGRRYGKDGQLLTSEKGAQGEMQVMPGTSRDPGFGVKPARDNSPDELARVGRDYANTLLARYGDPKLAAIAYNMGPGATDKWLAAGADMSKLPKETQGYVKGFAGGGEVQHFAKGDLVFNPETGMMEEEVEREGLGTKFGRMIGYGKGLEAGKNMPGMAKAQEQVAAALAARNGTPVVKPETKPTNNTPAASKVNPVYGDDTYDPNVKQMPMAVPAPAAAVTTSADSSSKEDPYAEFKDIFAKREANLAKQREQDKYMALLQAGLGMMGGTSRHALANIGAGGQQGIQALAQSNAARTAEENALLSGRLGLAKIGGAKEQADAMMQYRKELSEKNDARARDLAGANLLEKQEARGERSEAKAIQRLADISKNAELQAEKAIAANPAVNFAQDREAKKQAMIADILRRNSAYAKTYQSVHGKDADPFEGLGGTMGGDYGSIPEGAVRKVK